MKLLFTLSEVRPSIFLLEFEHEYDMCMMFLRYQEYYESSSPKFRGKKFEILDFMKWYSLNFGRGAFTYPIDWSGFNLPANIVREVHDLYISDKNIYDYEMWKVYKECQSKVGDNFYLIGASKSKDANITIQHEVAHGFFYLDAKYKKEMSSLVRQMDSGLREELENYLKKVGYTPKVYVDEIQANMATAQEWTSSKYWDKETAKRLTVAQAPFRQVFDRYYKRSDLNEKD